MTILNELAETIREKGSIRKVELWKTTTLSIWQFDKIRPYIVITFEDIIYNRRKQLYTARKTVSLLVKELLK